MSDPTGGETPTGHAPGLAQGTTDDPTGAPTIRGTALGAVPSAPEAPHSGEQATPEERREAWLKLMATLEQRELSAAQLLRALYRDVPGYVSRDPEGRAVERALARAWAARKLLEGLRGLQAPEVPRDDLAGQASILDLFPGAREAMDRPLDVEVFVGHKPSPSTTIAGHVLECHNQRNRPDWTCSCPPSTGVDNPGEDGDRPSPSYFWDDKGKAHQSRES